MVSIQALRDRLGAGENWVLFHADGSPAALTIPHDIGPATLLVAPVTDAVKSLSSAGLVDESLDRSGIWAVEGYALNRVVLERLEPVEMSSRELIDAVRRTGLGWQVKQMTDM